MTNKFSTNFKRYPMSKLKEIIDDHHNVSFNGKKDYGPYIDEIINVYNARLAILDAKKFKALEREKMRDIEKYINELKELLEAKDAEIIELKRQLQFAEKDFLPPIIDDEIEF
jgi:hypothetical protein